MARNWLLLAALAAPVAVHAQAQAPRGVDDPHAFIAQIYEAYSTDGVEIPDPRFAYSNRLRGLFDAFYLWQGQHFDGAGALDFDWWANANDWQITNVWLVQFDLPGERRMIEAHWRNYDREDSSRFFFIRENGRWVLDEVINGSGRRGDGWRLTALLRDREE